jgi:hypothetical protein
VNKYLNNGVIDDNEFTGWNNPVGEAPNPLVLGEAGKNEPPSYTSNVYRLNPALPDASASFLFPTNGFPYLANKTGTPANMPAIGITNNLTLEHDAAKGPAAYNLARFGVVPLDIRIEALIYAQEGSFFIIPGPWFNPNPNDTYTQFLVKGNKRPGEPGSNNDPRFVAPEFPFYGEPLDIRITMFGAITENLPAEIGDQGAWLQKWGWVPKFYGSTGLSGTPTQGPSPVPTFHGSFYPTAAYNDGVGNGINYIMTRVLPRHTMAMVRHSASTRTSVVSRRRSPNRFRRCRDCRWRRGSFTTASGRFDKRTHTVFAGRYVAPPDAY